LIHGISVRQYGKQISLRVTSSCSRIVIFFRLVFVVKYFRENLREMPGLLRGSRDQEDTAAEVWEWGMTVESDKDVKGSGEVVRDAICGGCARNYIPGFEGSKAVHACPSGRGNAEDRN
jgi:hypothetical protein